MKDKNKMEGEFFLQRLRHQLTSFWIVPHLSLCDLWHYFFHFWSLVQTLWRGPTVGSPPRITPLIPRKGSGSTTTALPLMHHHGIAFDAITDHVCIKSSVILAGVKYKVNRKDRKELRVETLIIIIINRKKIEESISSYNFKLQLAIFQKFTCFLHSCILLLDRIFSIQMNASYSENYRYENPL